MADFPYVQSPNDFGPRGAPALAFVVHMAEGGNTVAYLARRPMRNVSVHFVIDYKGKTTQMLGLSRVSGSINPNDLRTTNDAPFVGYGGQRCMFGAGPRRQVLGVWDRNPNHAVITVEVEGFAAKGPNYAQRVAIVKLYRYLVRRLPTIRGILGHRDFTSRKACPGRFIPWRNMSLVTGGGRHGLLTPAEFVRINDLPDA